MSAGLVRRILWDPSSHCLLPKIRPVREPSNSTVRAINISSRDGFGVGIQWVLLMVSQVR